MFHDFYALFYPAARIAANLVAQGEVPAWNPYSFGGMPFLASIQMGVFYPPNWLHLVVSSERVFCLLLVGHLLMAFAGTWLYCRGRGRSDEASVFAAIVFALSGRVILHAFAGHPHIVYSSAWLPCIFWLVDRCVKRPSIVQSCCLALALAVHFLAGFPMFSLLLAYLLPVYVLVTGRAQSSGTRSLFGPAISLGLAALLGLGIVAVQLLPTVEYMQESHRGGGLDYGWSTTSSYPEINVVTFLVPGFYGDDITQPYWGETSLWESTAFCGVATLLLALLALMARRPDRETVFWASAGLVVMLIALGRYSYVYDFCFYYLPGVSLFRGVGKLSVFVTLALAILASRGFDEVFTLGTKARRLTLFAVLCALIGAGFGMWAFLERGIQTYPPRSWVEFVEWVRAPPRFAILKLTGPQEVVLVAKSYDFMLRGVIWAGSLLTAYAILILARRRLRQVARLATLSLLATELYLFAAPYLTTSSVTSHREPSKLLRQALPDMGPWRFCCVTNDEELVNQFAYERFQSIGGVEASLLTRYTQFFQALTGADAQLQTYAGVGVVHETLFDLLNVRYYAAAPGTARMGDSTGDRLVQAGVFEKHGKAYDLFENVDALPRAFIVHEARSVDYPELCAALLPGLLKKGVESGTFVEGVLEPLPEAVTPAEKLDEKCEILEFRPSRIKAEVTLRKAGLLVVCENNYPGWVARIDGRPARVNTANLVMRSVAVPAGKHIVELSFQSRSLSLGGTISVGMLLVVAGLLAASRVRGNWTFDRVPSTPLVIVPAKSWGERLRQIAAIVVPVIYHSSLIALFFLLGGYLYGVTEGDARDFGRDANSFPGGWAAGLAAITALMSGYRLAIVSYRQLLFGTVGLLILFPMTVVLCEGLARAFVPGWPAVGLHGVDPRVAARSWSRIAQVPHAVGLNDWGQRDRPRKVRPAPGSVRIAFVGDSFLEESTTVPVSLRVEQKLGKPDVECINLGVSASSPDEYYYRIRQIALPMGASHCVMFIFAGNDFVEDDKSLVSHGGIAAVYPRGSFLQSAGLLGLNHLLTNRERPVIKAWLGSGDLRRQEEYRYMVLAESDVATVRELLLSTSELTPDQKQTLRLRLADPELKAFYEVLKSPDAGQFRSYYLGQALNAAATGKKEWEYNSETSALFWVRQSKRICDASGAKFTLVIVPEGCQVDSRMASQWASLADMRRLTKPCRDAAQRLAQQALTDGIEVIDLHEDLQDVPGTYLNLDGHWSDKGVEVVADVLAKRFGRSE